jgi:hypothetical protein
MTKLETWTKLTSALQEIIDAAELIEGFELDEDGLENQATIIKEAAQKVRSIAHDYIRPDKE